MLSIDKYAYGNRIAVWSPKTKALIWFLGIVLAFQPIWWIKPLVLVGLAGWTIYLTQVSFRQYFKWFYAILPFLLLSIIGIMFTVTRVKASVYVPIPLFGFYLGLSKVMLPVGIRIALQASAAIVCTYWFALTTPFQQIISLLKWLHLPSILIEETMLMYRFIFIFIEAFEQIYRAQTLRFGYATMHLSIHSAGILAKMLFEQVIVNYENMVHALDAKLFDGDFYVRGTDE